jgi:hypothetical protein
MPAKEEHGCDSGSESLDKHEPRDIDFSPSDKQSCLFPMGENVARRLNRSHEMDISNVID